MEDHIWQISQRVSFKEHYGKEYLFSLLVSVFDKVRILLLCRIKSLVFPWNVLQSKVILLKLILSFLHDKNMKMLLQRMKKQYRTKYFLPHALEPVILPMSNNNSAEKLLGSAKKFFHKKISYLLKIWKVCCAKNSSHRLARLHQNAIFKLNLMNFNQKRAKT